MSAAVKTPTTPGLFAAAERSTDLMIPWASGLRTNTACTMSPNARSVVYRPLPVTNLRSSRRRGDVPMEPDVIGARYGHSRGGGHDATIPDRRTPC